MCAPGLDADSTDVLGRELHGEIVRYDVGFHGQLVAVLRNDRSGKHLFRIETHLLDAGCQGYDRLALLLGDHDSACRRCGQGFAVLRGKRRRFVVDSTDVGQGGCHSFVVAGFTDLDLALRPRHDDLLSHSFILLCG